MMQRIFIGIPVAHHATLSLVEIQRNSLPSFASHWVLPKHFHLTLGFLGPLSNEQITEIRKALTSIQHKSFNMTFSHLEACLPHYIGLCTDHIPEPLLALHKKIQTICEPYLPEKRLAFKPHITLVKHSPSMDFKADYTIPNLTLPANAFVLYASIKAMDDLDYQPLARFPLG